VAIALIALEEFLLRYFFPTNRLMRAIFAGDVAQPAVNALFLINLGDDFVIEIQVAPLLDSRGRLADDVADLGEVLFAHPVFETARKLFDDAEAVMHDSGADLHAGRAKQEKLHRILPGLNAADAANRHLDCGIVGESAYHIERDRLDGWPTIAA